MTMMREKARRYFWACAAMTVLLMCCAAPGAGETTDTDLRSAGPRAPRTVFAAVERRRVPAPPRPFRARRIVRLHPRGPAAWRTLHGAVTRLHWQKPAGNPAATDTDLPRAEDITDQCLLNGRLENQTMDRLRDGSYRTFWKSVMSNGVNALYITAPESKPAWGVSVKLRTDPAPLAVQEQTAGGAWRTVAEAEAKYNEVYIPLPGLTEFRIVNADNPKLTLKFCEVRVLAEGAMPDSVHVWQDAPETVDMMLLSGHPDDEVLWFGGLLPYYAGERGKTVLVVCAAYNSYNRRLELLDALWTCGIRTYPCFIGYEDLLTSDVNYVLRKWHSSYCFRDVTLLFRRYRPKVVVLHDEKGEYGHGVHKAFSRVGRTAAEYAADPSMYPETQDKYPVYDIPKVYVHLWAEDQISMDWWQPLDAFGGATAQDVAREAYKCHTSQQTKAWAVLDGGEYDNALFGLWHTSVGPDTKMNDMFEHTEE